MDTQLKITWMPHLRRVQAGCTRLCMLTLLATLLFNFAHLQRNAASALLAQEIDGAAGSTILAPSTDEPTFGLAFINSAEDPSGAQRIQRGIDSGAQMDRFPLYWDRIETSYGNFNWAAQDNVLRANEAAGLPTLAILLGTPGHYARSAPIAQIPTIGGSFVRYADAVNSQSTCNRTDGPPAPSGLYNPIFSDGSDIPGPGKVANPDNYWARFVEQAVQRYRPGGLVGLNLRHWEIWNEPDLCHFWSGTPQEYARLLKVAYLVIKLNDPAATVMWGGLAHFANGQWLYDLVDALRADPMAAEYNGFFDAAASHHYSLSWHGFDYTNKVRNALVDAGWGDKPIWITESGVPICDDYPGPACPSDWRARPHEQAAYIWQNIAYTRLAGGGPIFHFMLHDDCGNTVAVNSPDGFGLAKNEASSYCSPANAEVRPAYRAFQVATQLLADVEVIWGDIQQNRQLRRVAFYQPGLSERRLMIWSIVANDVVATVPATGTSARLVALDGSETILQPVDGNYSVHLPGATNFNWPPGEYTNIGIYGTPFLLIEEDSTPPTVGITPLPEVVAPAFTVQWTARDLGSNVASTSLWVRIDGGDWQLWQENLPATGSSTYLGEMERRYEFALLAVDRAGNGLTQLTPLAQTTVRDSVSVQGTVIDPRGAPVVSAQVEIAERVTHTDEDGVFTLDVPIGNWDIVVAGQVVHRGRSFQGSTQLMLLHTTTANAIVNGSFEDGLSSWQPSGSSPVAVQQQSGTGDHALRLATAFVPNPGVPGEEGSDGGNSTVAQAIVIPGGQPYLALAYRFESQESEPGHDRFEVILMVEGEAPRYLYVQETGMDWRYRFFDLSDLAGRPATLIFNVYQSSPQRPSSALIDVVTLSDTTPASVHRLYLPAVAR